MGKPLKQAVLLIHGIGEQRPMDTLRGFVDTVWTKDTALHKPYAGSDAIWSKPYTLSENFELRRLTTPENARGWRTDFFEFYWAHLMTGTRLRHLASWAATLLLRSPNSVPPQLKAAYFTLWFLILLVIVTTYQAIAHNWTTTILPRWLSVTGTLAVLPVIKWLLTRVAGDAARYLHVAPENVQCRHRIRSAGVAILKSLHEQEYERIVVVGHSLGSVIGYDLLNYSWSEYHQDAETSTAVGVLENLAKEVADGTEVKLPEIQKGQRAYHKELRANGARWAVTDFITLGSPLAHATILLAPNEVALEEKFQQREYPRCLPELEATTQDNIPICGFSYPLGATLRKPHFGAVFGPTCWTNLFFKNSFLLKGDLIGGPLATIFGTGVNDVQVSTTLCGGLLSHTFYWRCGDGVDEHIQALRRALAL